MNEAASPRSGGVARALRGLGWVVAGLALALLTAWTAAYFWLGSAPGRALLGELAADALPQSARLGVIRWGPWPSEIAAGDLVVRGADGQVLLAMRSASADVGLAALAQGRVVIDRLEVELDRVAIRRDAEGRLDLAEAIAPPRVATAEVGPRKERAPPVIGALRVRVGELWLDLVTEQASVRDLAIDGALTADGALAIALRTGPCHAAWNKLRRSVGLSECRLAGSVEGRRAQVSALELWRGGDVVLALQGSIDASGEEPKGRWTGRGELGPDDTAALLPGMFPAGASFDGLALEIDGGVLAGSLGQLVAPRWSSGPLTADHVSFAVPRFSAEPRRLVPELTLTVEHLALARLEGLDWRLEGLWFPVLTGHLDRKLQVDAAGWSSVWTMPSGEVGAVDLLVTTELKLTGGKLVGQARTGIGLAEGVGALKTSPLTKRTDFVAELAFADARGPLAAAFMHDVEDAQRAALGEPIAGTAELEVEVDREDRLGPWTTTLEWALGRLEGADVTLEWDGYGWGTPAPAAPIAPDEEPP